MDESDAQGQTPPRRRSSRDRWVKLGILFVIVAVAGGVYIVELLPPSPPDGFSTDLEATLVRAGSEHRPVLAVFWAKRVNKENTRHLFGGKGLRHSQVKEAISKGSYLPVAVRVPRELTSDVARKYKLTRLPTAMVLSHAGEELVRATGGVGHAGLEQMLTEARKKRP